MRKKAGREIPAGRALRFSDQPPEPPVLLPVEPRALPEAEPLVVVSPLLRAPPAEPLVPVPALLDPPVLPLPKLGLDPVLPLLAIPPLVLPLALGELPLVLGDDALLLVELPMRARQSSFSLPNRRSQSATVFGFAELLLPALALPLPSPEPLPMLELPLEEPPLPMLELPPDELPLPMLLLPLPVLPLP
jgi:hypothetical protein